MVIKRYDKGCKFLSTKKCSFLHYTINHRFFGIPPFSVNFPHPSGLTVFLVGNADTGMHRRTRVVSYAENESYRTQQSWKVEQHRRVVMKKEPKWIRNHLRRRGASVDSAS